MHATVETLMGEIEASDHPIENAIFVSGLMAGLIAKHSGNNEFAAYMRMIVSQIDDHPKQAQDTAELDRLMDKLRERFPT